MPSVCLPSAYLTSLHVTRHPCPSLAIFAYCLGSKLIVAVGMTWEYYPCAAMWIVTINTVLIITNKQVTLFQSTSNIQLKVNPKRKSIVSVSISPIAIAKATLCLLQQLFPAFVSTAAPRLHSLQLLLHNRLHPRCSPIASASAAAPRLRPLQLLLPDYVRSSCCSPKFLLSNCVCVQAKPGSSPCLTFSSILCKLRGSEVVKVCIPIV